LTLTTTMIRLTQGPVKGSTALCFRR